MWSNLAVSKKLYAVVGLMAMLIAAELLILHFAMTTLSSVRAFVVGEGLWSKAQKDAVHSLYQYALDGNQKSYQDFMDSLSVTQGDHLARIELEKPQFDREIVRKGFIQGKNDPVDIDRMINLLIRFNKISYIQDAVKAWIQADGLLDELRINADFMDRVIRTKGKGAPEVREILKRVAKINAELTVVENAFSSALSEGSRWLEWLLLTVLVLVVFTIESTGIFLTYQFSSNLTKNLNELMNTTAEVGRGNFSVLAPVYSRDELGQLAVSLNKMIIDLRDSTHQQKKLESSNLKKDETLHIIIEAVEDYAIFTLSIDGFITSWNKGGEKIKGYTSEEAIGQHFSIFYTPEDRRNKVPSESLQRARLYGKSSTEGLRLRRDGTTFWAEVVMRALYDNAGKPTGFLKITHDITDRKLAEQKLLKLNEDLESRVAARTQELHSRELQLHLVANSVPVAIAQFDKNEVILFANDSFVKLFKISKEQVIGRALKDLVDEDTYLEQKPAVLSALKGKVAALEIKLEFGFSDRNYEFKFIPEYAENESVTGFIVVGNDVTKYKEVEAELTNAKAEAEVANATKSAFLANMSHEIRTPLTAILGFSEILQDSTIGKEKKEDSLQVIQRSGIMLSNLINDILDLSKVEAGKIEVEKQNVPLKEIVEEVQSMFIPMAKEKNLTCTFDIDESIPQIISTDSLRLRQILVNLIGNAIKFTDHGSVKVSVELHTDSRGQRKIAFIIKDTGQGLSPDHIKKLFTPFTQANSSISRKFGGTGLGLILSKKLANALGGDIELLESEFGVGSTFIVTIDPGNPPQVINQNWRLHSGDVKKDENWKGIFEGKKVLLVDDSPENRTIVSHYLKITGAHVDTQENGKDGVTAAMTHDYAIVLMDIQMPEMDGFEAVKKLRSIGYNRPVVALTAYAMKEDRIKCLEHGFSDHVVKPIDRRQLIGIISRHLIVT